MSNREKFSNVILWLVVGMLFITPLLRNTDLMEPWPLKWTAMQIAAGLALLYLSLRNEVALPTGLILKSALACAILRIISVMLFPGWKSTIGSIESICFVGLCLFFLTNFRDKKITIDKIYWPYTISSLIIAGLSCYQFYIFRMKTGLTHPIYISSTFGNINMMAEYIVFTLPFAFYYLRNYRGYRQWLAGTVVSTTIFCVFAGVTRSALIALAGMVLLSLYRRNPWRETICLAIAASMWFSLPVAKSVDGDQSEAKAASAEERKQVLLGALNMMAATPLGVGQKGFDFNFAPFQMATNAKPRENLHFETPHNMFVTWGCEGGWGFFIAALMFWGTLGFIALRLPNRDEITFIQKACMFSVLVELMFQFPFDIGASFLMLAFLVPYLISSQPLGNFVYGARIRAVLLCLSIIVFFNAGAYFTSNYLDATYVHNELAPKQTACEIYPNNWHACINYGRILALTPIPRQGVPILAKELERRPFNWVALKLLSLTYLQAGDRDRGCEVGLMYSVMMMGVGEGMQPIAQSCYGVQAKVTYQNPTQFRQDYESWLTGFLARQ